jgi:hypothetical protein
VTSPLLRLFTVFWWLLVIGSISATLWKIQLEREDYQSFQQSDAAYNASHPRPQTAPPSFNPEAPFWVIGEHPFHDLVYNGTVLRTSEAVRFLGVYFSIFVLPFALMTITRWIVTARWRFGPRW